MDNIHHKTTDGIFWKGTTDDEMDGKDQGVKNHTENFKIHIILFYSSLIYRP